MKKLFCVVAVTLLLCPLLIWPASQDFKGTINGNTITQGTGTLTISAGKTLTISESATIDEAIALSAKLTTPGVWTTPTFNAGDFTASGSMTWTVASGDRLRYAYNIMGKMMTLIFWIEASTVGGTPSDALYMLIPASKISAGRAENMVRTSQAASTAGFARASLDGTVINLYRDAAGNNWATGSTTVSGQITFEIQ